MQNWVAGKIKINTALAFLFGIVFLLIALCVSLVFPQSDRAMTKVILRIIVALSAASIAAGIPGLFALSFLSPGKMLTVRITGALLIFLIVCGIDAQPSEAAVFIEMTLILLTPALIQQGLRRQLKMKVTPSTLFLLSAAFILIIDPRNKTTC